MTYFDQRTHTIGKPVKIFNRILTKKECQNVMVTDPCYKAGDLHLTNLEPGKWHFYTMICDDRNAMLAAIHASLAPDAQDAEKLTNLFRRNSITEPLGTIGVDAGMVGIYPNWQPEGPSEEYYQDICKGTDNSKTYDCHIAKYGITSPSGYGDGAYNVFGKTNDKGNIVAIDIVFIEDMSDDRSDNPK